MDGLFVRVLRLCVGLGCLLLLTSHAFPQNVDVPSGPGYLLLSNGSVLHGSLQPLGNRVAVTLDETGKVYIRTKEIRFAAVSLQQLYEYKKMQVGRWSPGDHLEMAQWCMEQGLLNEVEYHYRHLKDRIADTARFQLFESQYKAKLLEDPVTRAALKLPPLESGFRESEPVTLASATASIDQPKPSIGGSQEKRSLAVNSDFGREYNEKVIPILRNRCGQSSCHGVNTTTRLFVPAFQNQTPTSSERSLKSALALINAQEPSRSLLIEMAVQQHSLMSKPAMNPVNPQDYELIQRIERWIALTAPQAMERSIKRSAQASALDASPQPERTVGRVETRSSHELPTAKVDPLVSRVSDSEWSMLEAAIQRLESIEKTHNSRDPFDPAQFNNQSKKSP